MSDHQNQPEATHITQSGATLVAEHENPLLLKSLTLPHGVAVDAMKAATLEGYDTVKGASAPSTSPDWSSEYSQSMRTLMEAAKKQPPEILHAADYVLEQVAKMTHYDEQKIIQARHQITQDLNDGSFAKKVETARHAIETMIDQQPALER
jgi:hypothetical protein